MKLVQFIILSFLVGCVFLFTGCGSSGDGSLVITGQVFERGGSTRVALTRQDEGVPATSVPVQGATVFALGSSDVTSSLGVFQIIGDPNSVPPETFFVVTIDEESFEFTADTTTGSSLPVNLSVLIDTATGEVVVTNTSPGAAGAPEVTEPETEVAPTPDPEITAEPTVEPTVAAEPTVEPTVVAEPEEEEMVEATPEPVVEPTVEPTAEPVAFGFSCGDGVYQAGESEGCGISSFSLSSSGEVIALTGFGENASADFALLSDQTAQAMGLTIFGIGDHTCTLECNASSSVLSLSCTNPQGGACSQTLSP